MEGDRKEPSPGLHTSSLNGCKRTLQPISMQTGLLRLCISIEFPNSASAVIFYPAAETEININKLHSMIIFTLVALRQGSRGACQHQWVWNQLYAYYEGLESPSKTSIYLAPLSLACLANAKDFYQLEEQFL